MAFNTIPVKYTDEQYLTKSELSGALGLSSIDEFWRGILYYRSQFQRRLQLKTIKQIPFYVTMTPAITQKVNEFTRKLAEYGDLISSLDKTGAVYASFLRKWKGDAVRDIANLEGKKIGEMSIRAISNGTYHESNPDHTSLLHFVECIENFRNDPNQIPSEDFLCQEYSILTGNEDLITFYRDADYDAANRYRTSIIGRDYDYAPADIIPDLMNEYFDYLDSGAGEAFVKAMASVYWFDYIKPFGSFNREIGCLAARSVMSYNSFDAVSPFIPFESIYFDQEKLGKLYVETQRSGDVTYIVLYAIGVLTERIEDMITYVSDVRNAEVEKEQYEEPIEEPNPVETAPHIETPQPAVAPTPSPTPAPVSTPVVEKPRTRSPIEDVPQAPAMQATSEMALASIAPSLSDKEIKEYAKYIVETNPSIRKPQALFYASHCIIGRYYTIQDYKKATRCVYETARTSMDNLAAEGFYKKLRIKNKFVYTPLRQGEKR